MTVRSTAIALAWAAFGLAASAVEAQGMASAWPARPLHFVIPFSAGGGNDIVARVIASKMSESLGQPVIIDNKPGGQGIIAVEYVQRSAPDGYTVLVGPSGPMTGNPATYKRLPYQTLRDFTPVTMIGSFPLVLVVNSSLPVRTVQELIDYAKERPNAVNYGSTAALFQLTSELFNQKTGTRFAHIPYKSSGDFVNAVLSNEITIAFADPPPASGPIKAGRLRALAITAAQRHPAWDLPTMGEAGVSDMGFNIWMGLFVPVATPAPIVKRIRDDMVKAINLPDVRERFASLGVDPSGMPGEEFAKIIAADIVRWTQVAKVANISSD
jgi:tripartite-type tricarboxylate transporter receptor subunit TctC